MNWLNRLATLIRDGSRTLPEPIPRLTDEQVQRLQDAADELEAGVPAGSAFLLDELEDLAVELDAWFTARSNDLQTALIRSMMARLPHLAAWLVLEGAIVMVPVEGAEQSVPRFSRSRLSALFRGEQGFLSEAFWDALLSDTVGPESDTQVAVLLSALVLFPRTVFALIGRELQVAPLQGAFEMTGAGALRDALATQRNWTSLSHLIADAGGTEPADQLPASLFDHVAHLRGGNQLTLAVRGTRGNDDNGVEHSNAEFWFGVQRPAGEWSHRFGEPVTGSSERFTDNWVLRVRPLAAFGFGRVGGEWHAAFRVLAPPDGSPIDVLDQAEAVEVTFSREREGDDIEIGIPSDSGVTISDLTAYLRVRDTRPLVEIGARVGAMDIRLTPRAFRAGIGRALGGPDTWREGITFHYELIELAWLADIGMRLNLQGRTSTWVVIEKSIGPLTLHGIEIVLQTDIATIETSATADTTIDDLSIAFRFHLSLDLGLATLVASGLGAWGGFRQGAQDISSGERPDPEYWGLIAPTGLGFELKLSGFRGGAFLERREGRQGDRIEWGGVLDLQFSSIGFTGFALYEQWLGAAADRDPSFLGIVTVRYTIPLFAGITLEAGSLLFGMHREIDADAMRRQLVGGGLDRLFFARNPIVQAPLILRDLRTFFPWRENVHVLGFGLEFAFLKICSLKIGAAFEIDLGEPGNPAQPNAVEPVQGEIVFTGVLALPVRPSGLELPSGTITALDTLRRVIRLNAHAVGVLDPRSGTFELDATLIDSRLLETMVLTGDAAVRVSRVPGERYSEVSIGGFHPEFAVAAGRYPALARIAIAIDKKLPVKLRVEGYLAFTDSAVMLGGKISVSGSLLGAKIKGWVYADILIADEDPFLFVAEIGGGVSVKYKGVTLAKITARGRLAGSDPTSLNLRATFTILFWDYTKEKTFNLSSISQTVIERMISVPDVVIQTVQTQSFAITASDEVVASGRTSDGDRLQLHPGSILTWSQALAPIGTVIEQLEDQPVLGGMQQLAVSIAGFPNSGVLRGTFSHDQYLRLDRAERLQAGGFSDHQSGVSFVLGGISGRGEKVVFDELDVEEILVGALRPEDIEAFRDNDEEPYNSRTRLGAIGPDVALYVQRAVAARTGARRVRAAGESLNLRPALYDVIAADGSGLIMGIDRAAALVRARRADGTHQPVLSQVAPAVDASLFVEPRI